MSVLDLTTAATQPFEPTAVHTQLQALVGEWTGTTRTWLDPSAPPAEAEIRARAERLLGGRFVRIDYASTVMGGPHAGQMILGVSAAEALVTVVWLDSFHTSPAIMTSVGAIPGDGPIVVLGSYAAGPERWGWRTQISRPGPDELRFEMSNISPAGEVFPGVELRLARRV